MVRPYVFEWGEVFPEILRLSIEKLKLVTVLLLVALVILFVLSPSIFGYGPYMVKLPKIFIHAKPMFVSKSMLRLRYILID